jgi:hypothetical protein
MWNQVIPNFTGNQTTPYTPTSPDLNKSYTQDFGSMPPIKPYTPPASMGPTPSSMYPNPSGDFSLQNQMYRWGQMLGLVK